MTLLYAATLFVSAALLFSLEPMVGKMILPALGGTPAVWNTCMVFFQAALLAGYAYSHGIGGRLGPRSQTGIHIGLLIAGLASLPIAVATGTAPADQDNPIFWLLSHLAIAIGLPFLAIAGTAPLIQKWFSQARHTGSEDPYFLYAASNAGSLAALLAYPLVVERFLDLDTQARVWTAGYIGLIVLIAVCGIAACRAKVEMPKAENRHDGAQQQKAETPKAERRNGGARQRQDGGASKRRDRGSGDQTEPSAASQTLSTIVDARRRVYWVVLAAVPSSLMLGVTTHITTNIAAIPLLWVIPLALYLLTFILCFARRERISVEVASKCFPFVALLVSPLYFLPVPFPELEWRFMGVHFVMFFLAAVICHGRLARNRPDPRHLTEYYLWISVGGVVGGAFNSLIAPLVFTRVIEYPLMICAVCLLRPGPGKSTSRERWLDYLVPCVLALLAAAATIVVDRSDTRDSYVGLVVVSAVTLTFGLACAIFFNRRSMRFGLTYTVSLATMAFYARLQEGDLLVIDRNFFGVKRVLAVPMEGPNGAPAEGTMHTLYHGTTLHGIQFRGTKRDAEPLAYYHPGGPIADLFSGIVGRDPGRRIGAVGLGAGAVAAYAWPEQHFDFYEIDPAVARIAGDARYFTFLSDCRGDHRVILGDGRLKLADVADSTYRLLLLDAYSSDAIPTHMLSVEAMKLYVAKADPHGVIAFHTSNRYMNLTPLIANLAQEVGWVARVRSEQWNIDQIERARRRGYLPAEVVVVARCEADFGGLATDKNWQPAKPDPSLPVWTDLYSDVVRLVLRGP